MESERVRLCCRRNSSPRSVLLLWRLRLCVELLLVDLTASGARLLPGPLPLLGEGGEGLCRRGCPSLSLT